MVRFSVSVAIRQLTGIILLAWLVWYVVERRGGTPLQSDYIGIAIAVALIAPEMIDAMVKAWKAWRGTD